MVRSMPTPEEALERQVAAVLVEEDGAEPEHARAAVARAMRDPDRAEDGALGLYRAARQCLRDMTGASLGHHETQGAPVRRSRPPPRGGTRKDTPAAKRRRR
jgi:hypothetical protein